MKELKLILIGFLVILLGVIFYMGFKYYNNQYYAQKLVAAIEKDDSNAVSKLLKSSMGNINSKIFASNLFAKLGESNNYTPLQMACKKGNLQIVKMLVDAGADLEVVEPITKSTPLGNALCNKNANRFELANYLIDKGANAKEAINGIFWVKCLNSDGSIDEELEQSEYQLLLKVVDQGVDIEKSWENGKSILHASASADNFLAVKYLVEEKKMDTDLIDYNNRTPLFFCNRLDIAQCLLMNGADKTRKDNKNMTAYDYALVKGNLELPKLLKP
jgi:FOG: Ankyrin repeat